MSQQREANPAKAHSTSSASIMAIIQDQLVEGRFPALAFALSTILGLPEPHSLLDSLGVSMLAS